ncbi:MAG: hypothetical protein QG657_3793 [Acidobacteriota bacterium]|nr:hypothetical protein [Acidobacteriota bacterium]
MVIDLIVNISDLITPELIAKAKENCSFETDSHPRQEYMVMTQELISYMINHQDLHNECIYSGLIFKLASYNSDEELDETTNFEPNVFENNIMKAAEALGMEYVLLVKQLYQYQSDDEDIADLAPAAGDNIIALALVQEQKKEMPVEERDILIELLHLCLLDMSIVSSSLEPATEENMPIDGEQGE